MFNAVQKENQPLAERVAEQIAQLIQERELKEGDRLPNEFDLAQELGVGRGTIRGCKTVGREEYPYDPTRKRYLCDPEPGNCGGSVWIQL